jgi:hypothetical protein
MSHKLHPGTKNAVLLEGDMTGMPMNGSLVKAACNGVTPMEAVRLWKTEQDYNNHPRDLTSVVRRLTTTLSLASTSGVISLDEV